MPLFFFITQNTGAVVDYAIGILHFTKFPSVLYKTLAVLKCKAPFFSYHQLLKLFLFLLLIIFFKLPFPMSAIVSVEKLMALWLIVQATEVYE